MTLRKHLFSSLFAALAIACSTSEGGGDAGTPDTGPGDGGVRALCPMLQSPACTRASECGSMDEDPSQAACKACVKTNPSACLFGGCVQNPPLMVADRHDVAFDIVQIQRVQSFHLLAVTATSAGGLVRTCEDVYAGRIGLDEPCNNVIESRLRTRAEGMPAGTVLTMSFSRFTSGLRTLFVVYGYESADTSGSPIGITCAEKAVGGPGVGITILDGGRMRPL